MSDIATDLPDADGVAPAPDEELHVERAERGEAMFEHLMDSLERMRRSLGDEDFALFLRHDPQMSALVDTLRPLLAQPGTPTVEG